MSKSADSLVTGNRVIDAPRDHGLSYRRLLAAPFLQLESLTGLTFSERRHAGQHSKWIVDCNH